MLWMGKEWSKGATQSTMNALMTIGFSLIRLFVSGLLPILDAQTMIFLSKQSTDSSSFSSKDFFGIQRLWECLGDLVKVLVYFVVGKISETFPASLLWNALFISCVVIFQRKIHNSSDGKNGTIVSQQQDQKRTDGEPVDDSGDDASSASSFCKLVTSPRFLVLLCLTVVGGVGNAMLRARLKHQCYLEVNPKTRIMKYGLIEII